MAHRLIFLAGGGFLHRISHIGLTDVVLVLLALLHLAAEYRHQLGQLVALHLHAPQLLRSLLAVWASGRKELRDQRNEDGMGRGTVE